MKKILLSTIVLTLFSVVLPAFSVTSNVSPKTILAGEAASFGITSDSDGDINFELPDVKGINWIRSGVSTSRSYSSVNGRTTRSVTRSVYFTAAEPGEYEIPAIEVTCGKEKSFTKSVKFKVLSPGSSPGKSGNVPAQAQVVWPDTGKFYTGQWIPLDVVLTVPDGMDVGRYSFPKLNGVENLIFYNFSRSPSQRRDFGEVKQERTVYKNVNATQVIFPAAVRAITAEVPDITGVITLGIIRRDDSSRRGYDSFFDSFFERMNERIVPVTIQINKAEKKPQILMLPPVPPHVNYLEVFGKTDFTAKFSADKCTVGEAVELIVTVKSDDISQLKAPELKLDKFRIYKPEVKSAADTAEIRYCFIPLAHGITPVKISFASFDAKSGKYLIYNVEKTLDILPSKDSVTSQISVANPVEQVEDKTVDTSVKTPSTRTEPLYIKTSKYIKTDLNLWKNSLWYYVTGFIIMPLAALFIYMFRRKKNMELANPEIQLKRSVVKYASAILSNSQKVQLSDYEKENIIAACACALDMAQGTSASEIASKIKDDELREWFRKTDESSFNALQKNDIVLTDSIRRKLLKLIKSCLILIFMALPTLYGNEADKLFDSGKYLEAAKIYRKALDVKKPSVQILYNMGTCYLHAGKLPLARAALLAAHKLAPRDEEVTENLNLVNRRLVQSEVNKTDTPRQLFEYCRDRLRPDEHLAMAAIIFGIAMLVLALNPESWKKTVGISGTAFALFIFLMTSQLYTSYAPYQAVTLPEFLELKQLPSSAPSEIIATVPGGSDAQILQIRGNWLEITVNGKTGWVKSDTIALVTH